MKVNILITGISSSNALSFIKGLRKQNEIEFTFVGTDTYERVFSTGARFVDKFFKVPPAGDKRFVPTLIEICKKNKINIVIPIIDEEFLPISKARDRFKEINTRVMLSDHKHLMLCRDKYKTYLFFKKHDIPTPATALKPPAEKQKYPVLMKPRIGRGSKNIITISSKRDIKDTEHGKYIYQEIIKGLEYTIDTLSDMNGKIIAIIPRIRLEIRNGVSYKAKTVKNKIIEDATISICKTLGLKGPACIQCIITPKGSPYFFEINPRIGSAVILAVHAGINIPLLAIKNILGMKLDNMLGKFKDNVVMLRYWEEVFMRDNSDGTNKEF